MVRSKLAVETPTIAASERRGFYSIAEVYPYERRGAWVWFDTGVMPAVRRYAPMAQPDLAAELGKCESLDDAETFVRKHGPLGWHHVHYAEGLPPSTLADEYWRMRPVGDDSVFGEPLVWVLAHAHTIRWCLNVEARRGKRGAARVVPELPSTLAWRHEVVTSEAGYLRFVYEGRASARFWRYPYVLSVVDFMVNQNLRGASHCLVRDRDGRAALGWDAPTTLDALYILTAEAIAQQEVALCEAEHCGKPFRRTHRLQRYCPPPNTGPEGYAARSACSNQQRQRAFIKRHRSRTRR